MPRLVWARSLVAAGIVAMSPPSHFGIGGIAAEALASLRNVPKLAVGRALTAHESPRGFC